MHFAVAAIKASMTNDVGCFQISAVEQNLFILNCCSVHSFHLGPLQRVQFLQVWIFDSLYLANAQYNT